MAPGLPSKTLKQLRCIIKFLIFCKLSIISAAFLYPILLIIFIPILIYRQIIKLIVKVIDPKCGAMLTGLDATLAGPDPYKNVPMILSPYFTFNSKLDRAHIVKIINEKVIQPNLFPELQQRIVRKYGYFFRYPVEKFSVENHVRYLYPDCPDKPVKRSEIRSVGVDMVAVPPFGPTTSPWELVLIPNFVDEDKPSIKSCMFLRVNHCLMDGYSLINFTQKVAMTPWKIQVGQITNKRKRALREMFRPFLQILTVAFTGPYHVLNMMRTAHENNDYLKNAVSSAKEGDTWCAREMASRTIDAERLRKIRRSYNVSVSSILMTMAVEAVRKYLRLQSNSGVCKMPEKIYFQMTFPVPGHPDAMTNHWTVVKFPITLNNDIDPIKTLESVDRKHRKLKTSVIPLVTFLLSKLGGLQPICMFPNPKKISSQTLLMLNMPGPPEKVDMFGYEWEDFGFTASRASGSAFVAVVQYMKGKFWVDMAGARTLVRSQEDMKLLEEYAHKALTDLETNVAATKDEETILAIE